MLCMLFTNRALYGVCVIIHQYHAKRSIHTYNHTYMYISVRKYTDTSRTFSSLVHINVSSCPLASLQWRYNGRDSVSNHQPRDSLLNRLYKPRSKKTTKPRFIGLGAGNSPLTGEFPAQMASNAEKKVPFDDGIMLGSLLDGGSY